VTRPVIAGVDGSPPSLDAARYAAALARRRGASLELVHGHLHPLGYGSLGLSPASPALPDAPAEGQAMLDELAASLRADHPGLEVRTHQVPLGGAPALIDASGRAAVVVVGHRGLGGFAELLLGSVGAQVSAHARCPVVVYRPPAVGTGAVLADPEASAGEGGHLSYGTDGPVVVGVDGSATGAPAIDFAFAEASARGVPLVAVHVYWARARDTLRHPDADADAQAEAEAHHVLYSALAPHHTRFPAVEVRRQLTHGLDPEHSLVEASRKAALVVVGSRGRGGFTGLLLGSVSQTLIHHAQCPVAVVHGG